MSNFKYRGPKSLIPVDRHDGLGHNTWFYWKTMPYGTHRRKAIIEFLRARKGSDWDYIAINKKHCLILKRDPDLKRMLKQGILEMHKEGSRKCTYSVLRLKD